MIGNRGHRFASSGRAMAVALILAAGLPAASAQLIPGNPHIAADYFSSAQAYFGPNLGFKLQNIDSILQALAAVSILPPGLSANTMSLAVILDLAYSGVYLEGYIWLGPRTWCWPEQPGSPVTNLWRAAETFGHESSHCGQQHVDQPLFPADTLNPWSTDDDPNPDTSSGNKLRNFYNIEANARNNRNELDAHLQSFHIIIHAVSSGVSKSEVKEIVVLKVMGNIGRYLDDLCENIDDLNDLNNCLGGANLKSQSLSSKWNRAADRNAAIAALQAAKNALQRRLSAFNVLWAGLCE